MFYTKKKKGRNAPISKLNNKPMIIVMPWPINSKYNININSHNIIGGMKDIFSFQNQQNITVLLPFYLRVLVLVKINWTLDDGKCSLNAKIREMSIHNWIVNNIKQHI